MTHPHPWHINDENEQAIPGVSAEVEVCDANGVFVCWAYQQEAEQIVAMSEAVGLLRKLDDRDGADMVWYYRVSDIADDARALLARIDGRTDEPA